MSTKVHLNISNEKQMNMNIKFQSIHQKKMNLVLQKNALKSQVVTLEFNSQ